MVVVLCLFELQIDEALIATSEGALVELLGLLLGRGIGVGILAEEGIATDTCSDGQAADDVGCRG